MLSPPAAEEDDYWVVAAGENPILAASELYFLARPSERVPWRHLLLPERFTWGRKRTRSKAAPAAAATRASPTTPFSWSAASTSSGDAAKEEAAPGADPSGSGGGDHGFSDRSANVEAMCCAAWGYAAPASKVAVAVAGSRPGRRKMSVVELRGCERSLLEKKIELRKELEKQRLTREHLMEENARLRELELKLTSGEARGSSNATPAPESERRQVLLPFDLNEPLAEDHDPVALGSGC